MDIKLVWDERLKAFYSVIVRYFLIIAMSVLYSFIIFGSIFVYYYFKSLNWLPPYFPTEIIASLLISFTFLKSKVRTFLKKADIIFLIPAETNLSLYFRKSIFYSTFMDAIRLIIGMVIISPLVRHAEITITTFLIISSLIILNIRLTWVEQWLENKLQRFIHRLIRFLSYSTIPLRLLAYGKLQEL